VSPLLRSELRATASNPVTWWLLLAVMAIGVVGTLAPLVAADATRAELLTDRSLQEAMHGAAAGASLVLVAGIVSMAGEWRWGQVTQSLLTTPRRAHLVVAKVAVNVGVGAVFGLAAGVAALLAAMGWYRANDLSLPLDRAAVWLTLLGCLAVSMVFGVLGVAVGAIVRNVVAAVVGGLAWQVLVEPALFAAAPSVFRWLPGMASFTLRRQPAEGLLTMGPAVSVLVVVLVGAVAAGIWIVERTDVTA
jgi:ABC-2 type transport system permease protein